MEFRLEDFDNQQEPSIDLEGKSVEENSFGEKTLQDSAQTFVAKNKQNMNNNIFFIKKYY